MLSNDTSALAGDRTTATTVAHDVALNTTTNDTNELASPIRLPANVTTGPLHRLQADTVGVLGSIVGRGTFTQSMHDRVFTGNTSGSSVLPRTRSFAAMLARVQASSFVHVEPPTGPHVPSPFCVSRASLNDSDDDLRDSMQSNGVTTRGSSRSASRVGSGSPPLHNTSPPSPTSDEGFGFDPNGWMPFFADDLAADGIPYPLKARPVVGEQLFKKYTVGSTTAWRWRVGTVIEVLGPYTDDGWQLRVQFDHTIEYVRWPAEYENREIGFPHVPHPDSATFPFGRDSQAVRRGTPVDELMRDVYSSRTTGGF